jgi:hypothetical protein
VEHKKSPSNISTEELLEQLSTTEILPEEQLIKEVNDETVIDFIRFYNIQPGKELLNVKSVYKLYTIWCKKDKKLPSISFHVQFSNYFEKVHTDTVYSYLVDKKLMDLNERAFKLLKAKEPKRFKSPNAKAHFDNFLTKYNITNGTKYNFIWINSDVMYSLYDEYVYNIKKKNPLSETQFLKLCKIYFPDYKKDEETLWFNIHDSIKTILSPERISVIMTGRSQRRAKKKKQKKQNKASSIKT